MSAANLVIPAGTLYFQREDSNGNLTGGEHLMAETPGFTIAIAPNQVQAFGADTAIETLILDVTTRVLRTANITTNDISDDALALFTIGTQATVTQAATAVTAEALGTLEKDSYYQLGRTATRPTGIRGCTAVTLKAAGTAITLGTDYTLDAANGRIYILPTTALNVGAALTVDYTPAANARSQILANGQQTISVGLHLIADNTAGLNRDVYIPRATIVAKGDLALKSRAVTSLQFDANIKLRTLPDGTVLAPVYIDGRAA